MMKPRVVALALGGALAMFILASGCTVLAKKTTLVISFWGSPEQIKVRTAINQAFEKAHPGVEVKLMFIDGGSYWSKASLMFASGTAPDVLFMDAAWGYSFAKKGIFEDLGPYLKGTKFLDNSLYFTKAFDSLRAGKMIYGLPTEMNGTVMWYNQTIFDNAGVNPPGKGFCWDPDLLELGRKVTRDTNGDGKVDIWGTNTSNWYDFVANVIWAFGGEYIVNQEEDYDGDKAIGHLDMPQTKKALQYWADLAFKYHIAPRPGEGDASFASGKCAMALGGAWDLDSIQNIKKWKWDMAMVPQQIRQQPTIGGWGLVMNRGSKNKAMAWELMKFHSTGIGQTINGASGQAVPFEKAVAYSDTFMVMGGKAPKHHKVRVDSLDIGRTRFRFMRRWTDVESLFQGAVANLLAGKMSVQQLVDKCNPQITKILKGQM